MAVDLPAQLDRTMMMWALPVMVAPRCSAGGYRLPGAERDDQPLGWTLVLGTAAARVWTSWTGDPPNDLAQHAGALRPVVPCSWARPSDWIAGDRRRVVCLLHRTLAGGGPDDRLGAAGLAAGVASRRCSRVLGAANPWVFHLRHAGYQ